MMLAGGIRNVVCAVSGGVDSAVAALLLKRKGYNVMGVFMKNWDSTEEGGTCSVDQDRKDAQEVCHHLEIPFHEVNFVKEYWNDVFSKLIQGYEEGTTPNPDILCNRHVKFSAFMGYATEKLGADAVATGHYAKNSAGEDLQHLDPVRGARLLKPVDQLKDQTLFLSQIPQAALQKTMFPIGDLTKEVVKKMAMAAGLEKVARKKESMGICFIGSRNFHKFIEEYIEPKSGYFINTETGKIVGRHKGTHYWTLGQRTHIGGQSKAFFVAEVNPVTQEVMVAPGTNHPALFCNTIYTAPPHWINSPPTELSNSGTCECKFRFQHIHPLIKCSVLKQKGGNLWVTLDRPMRALTPGQYAVFYNGEECLGSARILRHGPTLFEQNYQSEVQNSGEFT